MCMIREDLTRTKFSINSIMITSRPKGNPVTIPEPVGYTFVCDVLHIHTISATRNFHGDAIRRYRKSFLFCFTVVLTMEVFHREIWCNKLVEHGIKLLCRYSLAGP